MKWILLQSPHSAERSRSFFLHTTRAQGADEQGTPPASPMNPILIQSSSTVFSTFFTVLIPTLSPRTTSLEAEQYRASIGRWF
jgi:hypothetical protein